MRRLSENRSASVPLGTCAAEAQDKQADGQPRRVSLYIHWPFCLAKCPYCDFNSHVMAAEEGAYVHALQTEMRYWARRVGTARTVTSIFFGGGTPSLLAPASVQTLIDTAGTLWRFDDNIEITLEANPTSSEAEKFQGFRAAGVNRLSLGVQALDDKALQSLGRQHSVAEALRAVNIAQNIFPRSSFDLIYARVGQDVAAWEEELKTALRYVGKHLSLYQLTIEPGTVFARQAASGTEHRAADDAATDMYALTQDMMNAAGLPAYEVSNHAALGEECRHNLNYWNYGDYIGIGAGAHGRITIDRAATAAPPAYVGEAQRRLSDKYATACLKPPQQWLTRVKENDAGLDVDTPLTRAEEMDEALLMGLRLVRGIDKKNWAETFGSPLDNTLNISKKAALIENQLLAEDARFLRATPKGMMLLTSLTAALSKTD